MDKDDFERYLKKGGRSKEAIERCISYVTDYEEFLKNLIPPKNINDANAENLSEFIGILDQSTKPKSKSYLWALAYYFDYIENQELNLLAKILREERIERRPFSLRAFKGINVEFVKDLSAHGIITTDQMLHAGSCPESRRELSSKTGIPEEAILEFVKLSDLARIPGVKGVRARLYYELGIDSVEKMGNLDVEELRNQAIDYVERSNFDGIPPLPAEVEYTIAKAKKLPVVVQF
jgi:hypothetical protein